MLLVSIISVKIQHNWSCGSICVVYGLYCNPKLSTNSCATFSQSTSGYAILCALKLPTVPFHFPATASCESLASIFSKRYAKFASSFPTVVGVAFCPWVWESIGIPAYSLAFSANRSCTFLAFGRYTSCSNSFSIIP